MMTTALVAAGLATTVLPAGATSGDVGAGHDGGASERKVVQFAIDGFDADYLAGRA